MKRLKLDNFDLYEYNDSLEHQEVIRRIEMSDNNSYLGNIKYAITRINQRKHENPNNFVFIAYYNDYPMGYISLTYLDNQYQVSAGTLPEYRKQNLSSLLLEEFSERILDYKKVSEMIEKFDSKNGYQKELYKQGITDKEIAELVLKIEPTNIASHKVAELVGYEQVDNTTFRRRKM